MPAWAELDRQRGTNKPNQSQQNLVLNNQCHPVSFGNEKLSFLARPGFLGPAVHRGRQRRGQRDRERHRHSHTLQEKLSELVGGKFKLWRVRLFHHGEEPAQI